MPGHEEIELALCRMYDVTGEEFLLDTWPATLWTSAGRSPTTWWWSIRTIVQRPLGRVMGDLGRKYAQHQAPVREQDKLEGHAVRALYLVAGMADVAERSGDKG